MLKAFLDRIAEMAGGKILAAHGKSYSLGRLEDVPSPATTVEPIQLHALSGLCSYVQSGFDQRREPKTHLIDVAVAMENGQDVMAIVIDSPRSVRLVSHLFGDFRQRDTLVSCAPYLAAPFPFGKWLDVDQFIIQGQACFVRGDGIGKVLEVVGNMEAGNVGTWTDDGITQEVTRRKGIARMERATVPNPVRLAPYRTFQEIIQPESSYVLRVNPPDGEDDVPQVALFEVADNEWQIEAARGIKAFLREHLEDIPIFC